MNCSYKNANKKSDKGIGREFEHTCETFTATKGEIKSLSDHTDRH